MSTTTLLFGTVQCQKQSSTVLRQINTLTSRSGAAQLVKPSLLRSGSRGQRRAGGRCFSASQGLQLLSEGQAKYAAGNRVAALSDFEQALLKSDLSPEQRVAAQWNSACVHAYYGDVELAQISLKEALFGGLDFAQALAGEVPGLVKMQASAQVLNQLRRFAGVVQRNIAEAAAAEAGPTTPTAAGGGVTSSSSTSSGGVRGMLNQDISERLQTDTVGIDSSLIGMVRRVTVLLLALSGLGAALFYLGLKYAFPESQ